MPSFFLLSPLPLQEKHSMYQVLHLNQICSKIISFDIDCNNSEKWLIETGCSEKVVCLFCWVCFYVYTKNKIN